MINGKVENQFKAPLIYSEVPCRSIAVFLRTILRRNYSMSNSKTDFVNFVNQMAAENDTESFLRMTENPDARDFGPASIKKTIC